MRFINKWSYSFAKGLADALNENHQSRRAYNFGFQVIIGESFKTVVIFLVALVLGVFLPALIVTMSFVTLRVIAGGYHMDSQGKCLITTLILIIPAAWIAKLTNAHWSTWHLVVLIFIAFIAGLYALIRYAPRDNPNKPITDPDEIRKFKRLSLIYLTIWLAIMLALTVWNLKLYVVASGFGILLELFMITQMGHNFFDFIKTHLSIKRR